LKGNLPNKLSSESLPDFLYLPSPVLVTCFTPTGGSSIERALLTVFIIIDQRIVIEASHILSLQEALYIMWGKMLRMKCQNVFLSPLASVDTNYD